MKHYKAYLNEFYQLGGCGWSVDTMKQIIKQERSKKMKELYYMTRYVNYMTDAGYYESMEEQLKELDSEQLAYLCKELAPQVYDQWNEILFEILYYVKPEDLDVLIKAWEYLASGEFENFLDVLSIDYERYLDPDDYIYDYDTLEAIFVFNGYCYDTFDEALLAFVDFDNIKNDILDYFK